MKICYVASPASVHTQRWLEQIEAQGHRLQLVALGPQRADWPNRWPICALPADFPGQPAKMFWRLANVTRGHQRWVPSALWLWGAFQVRRLLDVLGPDLVHVHYVDRLSMGALLSGFHPMVVTPWGSDLLIWPETYTAGQRRLLRYGLSRADLVMCNSPVLQDAAIRLGARPEKTRIRQWGVDLQSAGQIDVASFQEQWALRGSWPVLLSARNPQRSLYCIDRVFRAFSMVVERCPNAVLLQLWDDSFSEPVTALKNLQVELGIAPQVRWLGHVREENLAAVFGSADVTLSLATSDSLPTSLLEAMAYGSVPIFSGVGGVGVWIVSGETGVLVPPGDAQALVGAIAWALEQPSTWWDNARARNRELVCSRADRRREFQLVAEDYAALAKSYAGRMHRQRELGARRAAICSRGE